MEELALQDKPGFFSRISGFFLRDEPLEDDDQFDAARPGLTIKAAYRYTVTVRRQIQSFDDAISAADGLRRGEQQILNLVSTEPATRQKIVDFMCGVNYAQEGTWEEIGDNIYLVVPASAHVEVAGCSPKYSAQRN